MPSSMEYRSQRERTVEGRAYNFATELIEKRYERGFESDRMWYHNREHTDGVVRRAREIAKAMGLNKRERWLVEIAASFHDVVQEWGSVDRDGTIVRQRRTGSNEQKSADEAVEWMKAQKPGFFSERECQLVREAIMATIPTFDAERGTVVQGSLTRLSDPVVRAVALADIGASGMEPEVFSAEGNSLFLEQEMGMVAAITAAQRPEDISSDDQQKYLQRYKAWMSSQVVFAKGRHALLESELGNLDSESKAKVRELFSHIEESLSFANAHKSFAETCTFEQMTHLFFPHAFSDRNVMPPRSPQ